MESVRMDPTARTALYCSVLLTAIVSASASVDAASPASDGSTAEFSDFAELDLLSLLDAPVEVGTFRGAREREAPSVLTVIRREEILDTGARDLIDLLRLVPGLQFAVDVEGATGIGVRGVWGHEGKVLLLLDGMVINEHSFSTIPLAFHIPLDILERVEVIRGPGSVQYGGYAELAVVNLVTRKGADLSGSRVSTGLGMFEDGFGFAQASGSTGRSIGGDDGLEYVVSVAAATANPSDVAYLDFHGQRAYAGAAHRVRNVMVHGNLSYRGWRLRLIGDDYRMRQRDGFGFIEPVATDVGYPMASVLLDGDIEPHPRLLIVPMLAYTWQRPWYLPDSPEVLDKGLLFDERIQRIRGGVRFAGLPTDWLSLMAGSEYYEDHAYSPDAPYWNGATKVRLTDVAVFGEIHMQQRWIDAVVGARYEDHSEAGDAFVPRAALTGRVGDGHLKFLASQAFRAPGMQHINLNQDIRPELTTVYEAEVGWLFERRVLATVNGFHTSIERPIVYEYDERRGEEMYRNDSTVGTWGVEMAAQGRFARGWARMGYAFYRSLESDVGLYAVPGEEGVLIAFAPHQWVAAGGVDVWRGLRVNSSATVWSSRWGYLPVDDSGEGRMDTVRPAIILDLTAVWRNAVVDGLDLRLAALNLLDDNWMLLQAYDGGHAPLPGRGRQYTLAGSYAF